MIFEERDKPIIKNINSNLIRAEQSEDTVTRIQYSTEVVKDAMFFSLVLKNRGDYKHSWEYVNTALNVNRVITNMIRREQELVYAKRIEEEQKEVKPL
jgi:hypothetical protein